MSTTYDYPTDVTDTQWELLQPLLPERPWRPGGPGRPPCAVRRMLNGILYLNKPGCQWRMLPPEFGHWSTIYGYCKRWRRAGVWAEVMETLRPWERRCLGRLPEPSAGSMDSQRITTATQSADIGCDGPKKITGRQRHLLVDTLGLIIAVVVTDASTDDRLGLVDLLSAYFADGVKRLRKIWVDGASPAEWLDEWVRGLKQTHKIDLEATTHQEGTGFQVVPWRWAVGVSREGHIYPVGGSPTEVRSSSLVAWEALWRAIKTVKPSDTILFGVCATHQVVTCSERRGSLVTRSSGGRAALLPAKAARIARNELETTVLTGGVSAATWCDG